MKSIYFLAVFLFVLTKTEMKDEDDAEELFSLPYLIDMEKSIDVKSTVSLSAIGEKIAYVPLETKSDCLLKNIHELDFFNETLLVSDFNNLYQFTDQGVFMKKIGKRGSGPADYKYVSSVLSNNDHTSFEMFTSGKINSYDNQAEFSKTIRLDDPKIHPSLAVRTHNDNSLLYLGCRFKVAGDTTTIYSFAEINSSGLVVRKIPNLSPVTSAYAGMIMGFTPLYRYESAVRYMDYGNDTLFSISKEGLITPYAICRLGSRKREINTAGFNRQQLDALSSKLMEQW